MAFLFHLMLPKDKVSSVINDIQAKLASTISSLSHIEGANSAHVQFRVSEGRFIAVMRTLTELGVGDSYGVINVVRLESTKPLLELDEEAGDILEDARKRLPIEFIYDEVSSAAKLTPNYVMYLCAASIIAAVGLATSSTVSIIASMLISPLMGPILGFTFGTILHDKALVKQGLISEIAGFLIIWVIGFLMSIWLQPILGDTWPTAEISSRGTATSLWVGVVIALASGVGVALALTDGGINSLVGVAISASLLPPVVNSGMSFCAGLFGRYLISANVNSSNLFRISGVSALLWLINVVCIYLAGLMTFKLKAVGPIKMSRSLFWADLPAIVNKPLEDRPWATSEQSKGTTRGRKVQTHRRATATLDGASAVVITTIEA